MAKNIEHPIPGQIYTGTGGRRKVIAVNRISDRIDDYDVEWQRPDNENGSTVIWLRYWARWARTAKLVPSNMELTGRAKTPEIK